jgi:hypothetical protein
MEHFSEHMLELYARNSDGVQNRRAEIEQHLAECFSCRELVLELQAFYDQTDKSKKMLAAQPEESSSLVMEAHIRKREVSSVYVSHSLPARIIRFVKKQPVASSMVTLGLIVLGLYSFNTVQKKGEENPVSYQYNTESNCIAVYNKNDVKLWEKRLRIGVGPVIEMEKGYSLNRTVIADIDQDGLNEVIILSTLATEEPSFSKVKIFDAQGKIKKEIQPPFQTIRYISKKYDTEYNPSTVLFGGNQQKNFYISYENGRSPSIIARYDGQGKIVGTFKHFGQLSGMLFYDVDHDGKNELILNGINDTEDETKRSFAVTVILDPDKITGDCESSATKGFGLPSSSAELYYIRYPIPEIIQQSTINLIAKNTFSKGDKEFRVLCEGVVDKTSVAIEYFFDSTLAVRDVKFASQTLTHHNLLYKQGKLSQPITEQYIRSLKEAVLFWDGATWGKKPVRIGLNISQK